MYEYVVWYADFGTYRCCCIATSNIATYVFVSWCPSKSDPFLQWPPQEHEKQSGLEHRIQNGTTGATAAVNESSFASCCPLKTRESLRFYFSPRLATYVLILIISTANPDPFKRLPLVSGGAIPCARLPNPTAGSRISYQVPHQVQGMHERARSAGCCSITWPVILDYT